MNINEYNALSAIEKLNLFRNKYYNDGDRTEKGVIANAINEVMPALNAIFCSENQTENRI